MKLLFFIGILVISMFTVFCFSNSTIQEKLPSYTSFYDLKINSIDGKALDLSQFKDHVILLVNTASKCGFTNQYKDLESLYNKYKNKKFVIIGFPANNFMRQEPGTNKEIKQFCEKNYGVSFPITERFQLEERISIQSFNF